ncbi:hypothetical protein BT69DRAFT_1257366 [Atractiella rhizophila]|nr:hypothetical protein BT69DRAFT_1257366 [Atractiella rhizophila]
MGSTAEDAAVLLHDFVSSLDNLPSEVRFILEEIKYKEGEIAKQKTKIAQKDGAMGKHFQTLGLLQPMPENKEAILTQRMQDSYKLCEKLQDEKIMLAKRGVDLLNRHLMRLHKELSKIPGAMDDMQDVVFLPPSSSLKPIPSALGLNNAPAAPTTAGTNAMDWQPELTNRQSVNKNASATAPLPSPLPASTPIQPPVQTPNTSTPVPQPAHPITIPQLPPHTQYPVPFGNPSETILQPIPSMHNLQPGHPAHGHGHPMMINPILAPQIAAHPMMLAQTQSVHQSLPQVPITHTQVPSQPPTPGIPQNMQQPQPQTASQVPRKPGRPPRTTQGTISGTTTPVHLTTSASLPTVQNMYPISGNAMLGGVPKRASSASGTRGGAVGGGGRNRRSDRNVGRTMGSLAEDRALRGRGSGNGVLGEDDDEDVDEEEAAEEADDGTLYCSCQRPSFGDMIACDYPDCPFEWFHLTCVNLDHPPTGEWFCPDCRDKGRTGRERSSEERDGHLGGPGGRRGRGTRQGRKR